MNKNIFKICALSLLWITGLTLYILFLVNDYSTITFSNAIYIKYGVVMSSTIFALSSFLFVKNKKDAVDVILLSTALILTLVSDYFLLVKDSNYELGVGIFIFAQIAHFIRLLYLNKYNRYKAITFITIRLALPVLGIVVLIIMQEINLLYALVVIYIIQLIMNFVESLLIYLKDRKKWDYLLLAVGFLLFIGCDLCVGLANIGYNDMYNICWIFYAPSQLLISSHFVLNKLINKNEEE